MPGSELSAVRCFSPFQSIIFRMANRSNHSKVSDSPTHFPQSAQIQEEADWNSQSFLETVLRRGNRFGIGNISGFFCRMTNGFLGKETKKEFRSESCWEHELPESIEKALERTARRIRNEEIRKTLCFLIMSSLLYFWLIVLAEHWILTRGIPFCLRVILDLAIFLFWIGVIRVRIFPFWRWNIHPFYSAHVIEQARPELKNGLLNLLFLLRKERLIQTGDEDVLSKNKVEKTPREKSETLESRVLRLLEIQTARQVSGQEAVSSLAKGELTWWTAGTVCVLCLFLCYVILAPKNSFQSIARTLFPWSRIEVPTRVRILDIHYPESLYQGEELSVSAEIRGLNAGEEVTFLYSSEDRKYSDVPVLMDNNEKSNHSAGKRFWWNARVPDIRQTLWGRIKAGDTFSRDFLVKVLPPLRAEILDILIEPPAYSRLSAVHQKAGDLRVVDGTRVNLTIRTSEPAKNARLVLNRLGEGGKLLKQTVNFIPKDLSERNGILFQTSVLLRRSEKTGNEKNENLTAEIIFENLDGIQNRPLSNRWEILADRGPEIRIIEGPTDETEVKVSEESKIFFEASDPDFGLRAVAFSASWNGKRLEIPPLLNLPIEKDGMMIPFRGDFVFRAADWGLEAGDEILWWVEAADTCRPNSNRTETLKRRLKFMGIENDFELKSDLKNESEISRAESEEDRKGETSEGQTENNQMEKDGETEEFSQIISEPNHEKDEQIQESLIEDSQAVGDSLDERLESEKNGNEKDRLEDSTAENEKNEENGEGTSENAGVNSGSEESGQESSEEDRKKDSGENGGEGAGEGTEEGAGQTGEEEKSRNSGNSSLQSEEGSGQSSETRRGSQPKLAQRGFDPLSEDEALQEPGESEKKENGGQNSEKNHGNSDSGNAAGKENELGENEKKHSGTAENKEKDPSGAFGEESGEMAEQNPQTEEKVKAGKNSTKPQSNEPRLEAEAEDNEGDDGNEPVNEKKQTGKSHGGGAKTESEVPEDADGAQSGTEDGADSTQDLPDPVKEKENSDGSGLRDSRGGNPEREKMMDENFDEGTESEDGLGLDEARLPDEEMDGLKPDPVNEPGEAMEEILKHAEKELKSAGNQENPNTESPEGNGSDAPTPQEVPASTLTEGNVELQKNQEENSGAGAENSDSSQEKKEQEGGRSSNQDGNQSGNEGDRKSKGEIKPDNSVESSGRSEENRGGNRTGAEEQSNQQGLGRDGSNTPNEAGNPAGSGGEGPTGSRGGNSVPTDSKTGVPDSENRFGKGTQVKSRERESQAFGLNPETRESHRTAQGGGSGMGDEAHGLTGNEGSIHGSKKEDAVNLNFARQQTILALDHLRDALDRDDHSLLEYLGWTRDEALRFLQEWEKLHEALDDGNASLTEKEKAENRFRNLGLVPRSFQYQNQILTEGERPVVRGGRKIEPPAAWREHFEAYSRGVGSGN